MDEIWTELEQNKYFNELKGVEGDYYQHMADKLRDGTKMSSQPWRQIVKYFLDSNCDSYIPPIDDCNKISYNNLEAAEPLHNLFF